jgi:deoxyribonuclease IV
MLIGAQISNRAPLKGAAERDADLIQMFVSNPRGWKAPVRRADTEELLEADIPIYVHSPYLVNIAASNNRVRHPSRKILQQTCEAAGWIGAKGVIVHGGYCLKDEDPIEGFMRWRKALEQLETDVPILIENTAGGDNAMCRYFDRLEVLWKALDGVDVPLGFCLDTCHTHAAGEPLETAVERVTSIVGKIDLVHCNDSKDPAGSGRDRHENLGKGQIDPDLLVEVCRQADAPIVVETPGTVEDHAKDIAWLRERLG